MTVLYVLHIIMLMYVCHFSVLTVCLLTVVVNMCLSQDPVVRQYPEGLDRRTRQRRESARLRLYSTRS